MRLLYTILLFFLALSSCYSCSCRKSTPLTKQKYADYVFTGRVISVKEIITKEKISGLDEPKEFKKYEFTFQVIHFHKGKKEIQGVEEREITLR